MKKIFSTLGLTMAAILTLTNCAKENTTPQAAGSTFSIVASAPDTKTTADGMSTKWAENDQINVMYAAAGATSGFVNCGKFTVADIATGAFSGKIETEPSTGSSYDWYAIYPYVSKYVSPDNTSTCYTTIGDLTQQQEGNSSMAHVAGYKVPLYGYAAAQSYTGSAPSVAMKHLSTLFKVHVTNGSSSPVTISSITLTNDQAQIGGTFYVSFVGGNVSYLSSGEDNYSKKYIILQVSNGEAISAGASADFYITACPFTLTQGGTITVDIKTSDDATCTKTLTASSDMKFTAGKMKTLNVTFTPSASVTYNTIAEVLAACSSLESGSTSTESYNVKDAVVMAKSGTNYFILNDGTASILYYGTSSTTAVGDVVKVSGKIKNFFGVLEFASDQTIEKTGTATPSYPSPTAIDEAYITNFNSNVRCEYSKVSGTVDTNGYIPVGEKKVRVYNIGDTDFKDFKGKSVEACGYSYGYHSSGYLQFIATSMEEKGGSEPDPTPSGKVDKITAESLAATNTNYTNFSKVKISTDAEYAGNSAKSSAGYIQLRTTNSNSGIVSTVSGGNVKSVAIVVGSGTKQIDVYGSNTAYTSAADLYATDGNTNQGTLLGTLTTSGTVQVTGDYKYIGVRSHNGAIYLASIEITWE